MRLLAATAAVFAVLAAPVGAQPAWLPPATLAPAGAGAPAVATAPTGDAAVAWERGGTVEVRTRAPGQDFAPLQTFAGSAPDVAMAADGSALVTFTAADGVRAAYRPPGGAFGADARLAEGERPRVAMNARGDAVIAFTDDAARAAIRPAGGTFEAPVTLGGGPMTCEVAPAIGPDGDAAVAWRACSLAATAEVTRRTAGGAFGPVAALQASDTIGAAVTGDGTTVVVLHNGGVVSGAVALAAGGFTVDDLGAGDEPAIAAAGDHLWAAWRSSGRATAAHRPPGGAFTALAAASADGATSVRLGAAPDGSAVLTWLRGGKLEGARVPGGTVLPAGPAAGAPDLAVDGEGNALAAYEQDGITATVLDVAGPRITALQSRAGGFAETPYDFAVEAADAWSPLGASAFDFGDGTPLTPGPQARHTFATAGPRTITATVTDAHGNVTTTSRTFEVGPAPDRTAPKLTRLRLDRTTFSITSRPTAVVARARGTRFRYTLSEPAVATVLFERCRGGKGKQCKRPKPEGLIARRHPVAGAVSFAFSGRIVAASGDLVLADVRLKPGRYRASVIAADAARNASKPARVRFSVLR